MATENYNENKRKYYRIMFVRENESPCKVACLMSDLVTSFPMIHYLLPISPIYLFFGDAFIPLHFLEDSEKKLTEQMANWTLSSCYESIFIFSILWI